MLLQLHHQNKKDLDKHFMQGQRECFTAKDKEDFIKDMQKSHPLPNNKEWLFALIDGRG